MIKYGDKILRNLEEQVQYLTNYHEVNQGLVQWGIRVVGQVASQSDLPDPATYKGEYGDAIAVGTAAPFYFYIWTRASIEGGSDYWFSFGRISIVGPQGPKGESIKGDTGESTQWYSYNNLPNNPVEGDMALKDDGEVLRYQNNGWETITNIRGPQGITGQTGKTGPALTFDMLTPAQKEQLKGEKGDTGDVGGFINIYGIVSNTAQLPTPASLNNLTIAYLIGAQAPYDLWVQVGENSDVAVWTNTGPFNAGTLVSVNGNYQNVWNADTKLNKATDVRSADRAYIEKAGGGQDFIAIMTGSPVADTLVRRNSAGQIATADPTADNHAATKKYVDEHSSDAPIKSVSASGKALTPDANGNVNVPRGNDTTWGVVQTATADEIKYRHADSLCITATFVDAVVKYALCYDRYASFEKNWTETERESARTKLGVPSKEYVDSRTAGAYFCGSIWYSGNGAGTGVKINNLWIPYPPFRKDQTQTLSGHTADSGWDSGSVCEVDYNIKYSVDALQAKADAPANSIQVTLNGTYSEMDFSTSDPILHTLDNQTYNAVYLDNTTFEQTTGTPEGNGIFYYTLYEA